MWCTSSSRATSTPAPQHRGSRPIRCTGCMHTGNLKTRGQQSPMVAAAAAASPRSSPTLSSSTGNRGDRRRAAADAIAIADLLVIDLLVIDLLVIDRLVINLLVINLGTHRRPRSSRRPGWHRRRRCRRRALRRHRRPPGHRRRPRWPEVIGDGWLEGNSPRLERQRVADGHPGDVGDGPERSSPSLAPAVAPISRWCSRR